MSLLDFTASELLAQLEARSVSSVDATQACLDRIHSHDQRVGAFLRVDDQGALRQAKRIDERRQRGEPVGRLGGIPVAVKDLLCSQGERTTCGSRILENFVAPYDATAIARLKAADAVLIGRTNLDEFAMGGSTENSAFQKTRNPWDPSRAPGGSSGGSAACVAASMAPLAIGTDTGGSIRQPAGLCGVTGLKPTYGRVSRFGLVAFASSLDQIGPMAHSAEDCALALEVLAGHDPLDSTSVNKPVPRYAESVTQPLAGLTLGLVREHFGEGLDCEVEASVREAVKVYQSLGAKVREISLPHAKYGVAAYYIIAPSEASSNLARYDGVHYGHRTHEPAMLAELAAEADGLAAADRSAELESIDAPLVRLYRRSRAEGFGPEVKRRIILGTYALSAGYSDRFYLKALKVRRLIRQDYDRAFKDVDLIVGPVTAAAAFGIGEKSDDPLAMYLVDLYTVNANLAGIGGIAFPCGFSSTGLPIGLQLQAPAFEEDRLLRGAHMFQQATDWHRRRPKL
jgi:aspartyl-tRNA(Asn)/glutamyl-tRNA(Gln) amidotransferase subunit A